MEPAFSVACLLQIQNIFIQDGHLYNILLAILCYIYVGAVIFGANQLQKRKLVSERSSRKVLHAMIGNLILLIPFFTITSYTLLVAAPFILITLLASPAFSSPTIIKKISGLATISEEGHPFGLVFYAFSYTILAFFFAGQPYVMAAGIMPLAYGDSLAAAIGERYGKHHFKFIPKKTVEGTLGMMLGSMMSFGLSLAFFSLFYSISLGILLIPVLIVSVIAAMVELVSPRGLDNIAVPFTCVLLFLLLIGG